MNQVVGDSLIEDTDDEHNKSISIFKVSILKIWGPSLGLFVG
ncbi:MAG: hypothetical protein ACLS3S_07690 [Streptococcus salivarius]